MLWDVVSALDHVGSIAVCHLPGWDKQHHSLAALLGSQTSFVFHSVRISPVPASCSCKYSKEASWKASWGIWACDSWSFKYGRNNIYIYVNWYIMIHIVLPWYFSLLTCQLLKNQKITKAWGCSGYIHLNACCGEKSLPVCDAMTFTGFPELLGYRLEDTLTVFPMWTTSSSQFNDRAALRDTQPCHLLDRCRLPSINVGRCCKHQIQFILQALSTCYSSVYHGTAARSVWHNVTPSASPWRNSRLLAMSTKTEISHMLWS